MRRNICVTEYGAKKSRPNTATRDEQAANAVADVEAAATATATAGVAVGSCAAAAV